MKRRSFLGALGAIASILTIGKHVKAEPTRVPEYLKKYPRTYEESFKAGVDVKKYIGTSFVVFAGLLQHESSGFTLSGPFASTVLAVDIKSSSLMRLWHSSPEMNRVPGVTGCMVVTHDESVWYAVGQGVVNFLGVSESPPNYYIDLKSTSSDLVIR